MIGADIIQQIVKLIIDLQVVVKYVPFAIDRETSASTMMLGNVSCNPLLDASITESPMAAICEPSGILCRGFLGIGVLRRSKAA